MNLNLIFNQKIKSFDLRKIHTYLKFESLLISIIYTLFLWFILKHKLKSYIKV